MTSTSEVKKVSAVGNGVRRTFSFSPMVIFTNSELEVITTVIATGVETVRTLGTGALNYSISIADTGFPDTGSIDFPAAGGTLLPSTERISIRRVPPLTQLTDLESGEYLPQVQEDQFDRLVAIDLKLQEELDRCLKFPVSNSDINSTFSTVIPSHISTNASQFLRLNSARTAIELAAVATTTGSASDAAPQDVDLSAAAAGSNAPYSREDHVHFLPTTVPRLATENVYPESEVWFKGSDVASGATLGLGAGNIFDITGTTDITTITGIGIGTIVILHFDGILTLTASTNDLVLPGGEDIVTFAGYEVMLYEFAASDWRFLCDNADISLFRRQAVDLGAKATLQTDFLGDTLDGNLWNATAGSGANNTECVSIHTFDRYECSIVVNRATRHRNPLGAA